MEKWGQTKDHLKLKEVGTSIRCTGAVSDKLALYDTWAENYDQVG